METLVKIVSTKYLFKIVKKLDRYKEEIIYLIHIKYILVRSCNFSKKIAVHILIFMKLIIILCESEQEIKHFVEVNE